MNNTLPESTDFDPAVHTLLIIDDNPANLEIATDYLIEYGFRVLVAQSGEVGLERARRTQPDMILLDVMMPGINGFETCERLKADTATQDIPVIFMTALTETEHKVRGFQAGAVDYVIKPVEKSELLARVLTHLRLYELNRQLEQKVQARTAELTRANQQIRQIVDTVPEGVLLLDSQRRVILANPTATANLVTLAGVHVGDVLTRLGDRPLTELLALPPEGLWHEVAVEEQVFQVNARPLEIGPTPEGWVLVIRDVTQQREFDRRIQQQERLAAVGQLAAGIAHDFNNIMATIVLYVQMTARSEELPANIRKRMATINQQAHHATNLIRQIMDFGRRSVLERQPLDLLPFLKAQTQLLERTLPESIQVELAYEPGDYIVVADLTSMQQVVTNLALNARDAMPQGGRLSIGLERMRITGSEPSPLPEMQAGVWVCVTVSDTGTGIPSDALPHIFEPFFTTKAPGAGSGLGLAQVHGIVGQHEGHIDVETWVGEGTTFTIYLPALLTNTESSIALSLEDVLPLAGREEDLILVVEDNETARHALVESLELLSYQALEAVNGQDALRILEQRGEDIALVLSDVMMPVMGGIALLQALKERGLAVPVVMLTGHPLQEELESLQTQGIASLLAGWLPKPPSLEQLAQVVAQALREQR